MTLEQLLGPRHGISIVRTDERALRQEVIVVANGVSAIFYHRSHTKGRNSPARSLLTSVDRNGSSSSQLRHRNWRLPNFRNRNRMGLRRLDQVGAGAFLGMARLPLKQARVLPVLTVTDYCREWAEISNHRGAVFGCRCGTRHNTN